MENNKTEPKTLEEELWGIYETHEVQYFTTLFLDYLKAQKVTERRYYYESEEFKQEYSLNMVKQKYNLRKK